MAKDLFPGKRNSLDALCDRLGVDNSGRTLHGALLDAELLADVYIYMTRGQDALLIEVEDKSDTKNLLNCRVFCVKKVEKFLFKIQALAT
jgi:DNA polymerase III subunit epsilon